MYNIPKKIKLADLPTKIEYLEKSSKLLAKEIYIKRDDKTGIELSGNKVRKLEYAVAEGINSGADTLITCGALQSNHCRAVAAVAAKLGMKAILVLVDGAKNPPNGNYLLDLMLGADIRLIEASEYKNVMAIMEDIKLECEKTNHKAYIMPTGASNAIGMFGYIEAVQEIIKQEKELGLKFDVVVDTVGSTGTFAGLALGKLIHKADFDILGFSINESSENFKQASFNNIKDCCKYLSGSKHNYTPESIGISIEDLNIIDTYVGGGYAINSKEDFEFIRDFARTEGIFVDPVYTGKALRGLFEEMKKSSFDKYKNILFIHTGGLYGLFPKGEEFLPYLS